MSTRHIANGKVFHDSANLFLSGLFEQRARTGIRGRDGGKAFTLMTCFCPSIRQSKASKRLSVQSPASPRRQFSVRSWQQASSEDNPRIKEQNAVQDVDPTRASANAIFIEDLLKTKTTRTNEDKQLLWRAWVGLSEDTQATRLQLLESLLEMLQTEEPQDARRLRALLDSKYGLIDSRQRPFYSFWAHMMLQEPDIALKHYLNLDRPTQLEHLELFMRKIVETGDWTAGIKLWYHTTQISASPNFWHGNVSIRHLLDLVPNLHTFQFLSVLTTEQADTFMSLIRPAVVIHLSAIDHAKQAFTLVTRALDDGQIVGDSEACAVIQSLSRAGLYQAGVDLYQRVLDSGFAPDNVQKMTLSALYAATNIDSPRALRALLANEILARLAAMGGSILMLPVYTAVLSAFARFGQVEEMERLFDEFLQTGEKPDVYMLGTLLHVRVMTLEVAKARELFETCEEKYGIKPDQAMYNMLLHLYADMLDLESASHIMDVMVTAGFEADVYTAATLIDVYAHRKDGYGAKKAFDHMLEIGVVPNRTVYGSLMHAYVEAGEIDNMQDVLQKLDSENIKPNTYIMNILLKGLQKSGRSFEEMHNLVVKMEKLGVFASSATYTALLRAHVQENNLAAAINLFSSLTNPNEYHYTVLMVGLFREHSEQSHGQIIRYYHQMLERGLAPTHVTLAVLINACVIQDTPDSARQASALLDTYMSTARVDLSSRHAPRTRPSPDIFHSLLRRHKSGNIEILNTNKIFKEFLTSVSNTDGSPDVRSMTAIMSTYAATGQIDKVRSLFVAIKKAVDRMYRYDPSQPSKKALSIDDPNKAGVNDNATTMSSDANVSETQTEPSISQVSSGARFALASPFSIFTSAMIKTGRFGDIDRVWAAMTAQGYDFDDLNWNQFIRVHIIQGHIERGLELLVQQFGQEPGRIHRRTRTLCARAFAVLQNSDVVGDERGSDVWRRICTNYDDIIKILQA